MKALLALALCSACSVDTNDDRPETLSFLTSTIFAPTCGAAECHAELVINNRFQMLDFGAGGVSSGYSLLQVHYRL